MAQHSSPPDRAKRTANRLTQQKFRRQRKDYIAQLETELAMCRAGASEELVQRRQQVEQLAAEKKILRDMLIKVAHSLGNACGLDVTLTCPCATRSESRNDY
ncbi:hypothetical protein HBH46_194540 [Parastagonospora nodorum]|nr:hypothetical protein HBH46_194540 [Parastagonospora nodorum]KAH6012895.1 hypothetical protein HBI83_155150 [Parastagonospora nodorum]